ncbi:molybdate ABC transporter permease subunit [Mesoterricola silvestris]|uniref:Molybdenum transport system permease n=1 Tax=Mesoterricola silvestris TaxID=2927979 RepID=A0AA48GKT6_9BACT|nr:molybdate ABC transporter permease subunit [Mesoterricola silvestris]BDU71594.1 molybdenum ABC transporter permease subunit [Mesoterricola silvestris]
MDWEAIRLSLRLAACSVALLLPLGTLLAWPLSLGRFRGKVLLEALTSLPLILPPTVLGFYIIVALGPRSPIGAAWEQLTGARLVFSFQGLLLAQVVTNLPFFLQPLVASLGGVDRRLLEVASTLGSRPLGVYFRVALPLAWRGLLSAMILSFAHAIGEFGVVLMVGGNLPGTTRTASIALFDQVQAFDMAGANRTALLLLAFALAVLSGTAWLRSRERPWA